MKTISKIILPVFLAAALVGCNSVSKQDVGTVAGAAVGGVVGNKLTGGSLLGTVGGAAAGGLIGNKVGQSMDKSN